MRSQFSRTRPAVFGLHVAEHVRVAADELVVDAPAPRRRGRRRPSPPGSARGRTSGRGGRRARRAASRRRPSRPRPRPRRPPRRCAGRSCAPSARGPTGTRGAGARSGGAARGADRPRSPGGDGRRAARRPAGRSRRRTRSSTAYSFFTWSTHFVMASFFFCCSSCCLIDACSCLSGVVDAGFTSESAWMMCQPNCVWIGCEIWFFLSRKAALSNGATVWPRLIPPVSLPPSGFDDVSVEYFLASVGEVGAVLELPSRGRPPWPSSSRGCGAPRGSRAACTWRGGPCSTAATAASETSRRSVTFLKIASERSCDLTSACTCSSVRPCFLICARYLACEPPKYCFLICVRRLSTCLSVISMPRSALAFASNSVRCTRKSRMRWRSAAYSARARPSARSASAPPSASCWRRASR